MQEPVNRKYKRNSEKVNIKESVKNYMVENVKLKKK